MLTPHLLGLWLVEEYVINPQKRDQIYYNDSLVDDETVRVFDSEINYYFPED